MLSRTRNAASEPAGTTVPLPSSPGNFGCCAQSWSVERVSIPRFGGAATEERIVAGLGGISQAGEAANPRSMARGNESARRPRKPKCLMRHPESQPLAIGHQTSAGSRGCRIEPESFSRWSPGHPRPLHLWSDCVRAPWSRRRYCWQTPPMSNPAYWPINRSPSLPITVDGRNCASARLATWKRRGRKRAAIQRDERFIQHFAKVVRESFCALGGIGLGCLRDLSLPGPVVEGDPVVEVVGVAVPGVVELADVATVDGGAGGSVAGGVVHAPRREAAARATAAA